jgi:pSer/pThr/pTyr-binding forkhead associated (FHA) protein
VAYLQDPEGVRVGLGVSGVSLGRDETNELVLRDRRASRAHAQLTNRDGQWELTDLSSKNGTYVNGRQVRRHPLRDGDQIRMGDSIWRFHSSDDPNATDAATDVDALAPQLDLTLREHDVLRCVSNGLSDKEIAANLEISVNTVRSHLDRIREKTGLRKRSELTRLAIGMGLDPK